MSNVKLEIKSEVESQNTRNSSETIKREIIKTDYSVDVDTKQAVHNNNKIFKQNGKNGLSVASLEFEEVSSLSSSKYSDITISSIESYEDDVENIIVCVGNELAFQNYKDSKKDVQEKADDKKPESYRESNRSYDPIKYEENTSRSSITDRNKHNERNRSEDHCSRYRTPPRRGGSRSRYSPSRYRRSRSWDRSRSRYLSNRSRRSRSLERSRRYRDSGSQSYKVRRRRHSRSRSRSRSNSYRSPRNSLTKRRRLSSESPTKSIWKLLDRRKTISHQLVKSPQPPKTPPLPKLPPPPNSPPPPKPPSPVEQHPLIPQPQPQLTINNVTNVVSSSYPWAHRENHPQNVYQFQNPSMPRISINNLPLVPGFGNLPVHITMTGEQILHDMEGRPIPVGPNGLLLPLDLSGRLYPHIVFPYSNQAVPIYMSEDGVLRLPNGEPIPYGPPNQLPVNIDGCVIPIGPDSRPLYPCPSIPRENPLITPAGPNPGPPVPPPAPPQHIQPQIVTSPSVEQISTNTNAVQKLGQLPPAIIQIETVPDVKIKTEMKSDSKSIEPTVKPAVNVQKPQGKPLVNVKTQKKKLFEDVDLPELVLKFSEKVKNINVSAIYQKKLQGVDKVGIKGGIGKSVSNAEIGRGDKNSRAGEKNSTKDNEFSPQKTDQEKIYMETIKEAISFFSDFDFKPPLFGRFLFAESSTNFKVQTEPNESPLLRNKIQLPLLVPENTTQPKSKRPSISFRFQTQKTGRRVSETERTSSIAIQCDFTSKTFKILQTKIEKLKRELFRSRNENAELTDLYNSLREESQKKTDELGRVLKKIEDQNKMIKDLSQQQKHQ